jgi:hypothetical protein
MRSPGVAKGVGAPIWTVMRPILLASLAVGLTLAQAAGPAMAQTRPAEPSDRLREELDRGLEAFLLALRALLSAIPHYAPPEINENGDIIIRRLNPPPPPTGRKPPPADMERTGG